MCNNRYSQTLNWVIFLHRPGGGGSSNAGIFTNSARYTHHLRPFAHILEWPRQNGSNTCTNNNNSHLPRLFWNTFPRNFRYGTVNFREVLITMTLIKWNGLCCLSFTTPSSQSR